MFVQSEHLDIDIPTLQISLLFCKSLTLFELTDSFILEFSDDYAVSQGSWVKLTGKKQIYTHMLISWLKDPSAQL